MITADWTKIEKALPPEGVVVETVSTGGMTQDLYRQGGLWFVSDGSMYVYYTPMLWRAK